MTLGEMAAHVETMDALIAWWASRHGVEGARLAVVVTWALA